jgi:hypothetical protein
MKVEGRSWKRKTGIGEAEGDLDRINRIYKISETEGSQTGET